LVSRVLHSFPTRRSSDLFPFLQSVVPTADLDEGFRDVNWALLVGSIPRKAGMERKDLLGINGKIFVGQGQAIERNAAADVRVLVDRKSTRLNSSHVAISY